MDVEMGLEVCGSALRPPDENSQSSKDQPNDNPSIVLEHTPKTNEAEVYMFDTTFSITNDTA